MYQQLGLKKAVNASGKMSILGVSRLHPQVLEAMRYGASNFFVMDELVDRTGAYVARVFSYESAVIVNSASAGIALSVASVIGKNNARYRVNPYSPETTMREIVLPKGHNVDFGVPIETMISIGGGVTVEAGYANACTKEHIKTCVTQHTAALMYVKSHHCVQKNMLSLEEMTGLAHELGLPLILDAAAEEDLQHYSRYDIDYVIFSGAKALEGPTSGIVFGKKENIQCLKTHLKGIGRAMKIGKENILGIVEAVTRYEQNKHVADTDAEELLKRMQSQLKDNGIYELSLSKDSAGRDIWRIQMRFLNPEMAAQYAAALKEGDPAVYTREYLALQGVLELDLRNMNRQDTEAMLSALQSLNARFAG